MTNIYHLPDEVVCRIFILGCELQHDWDFKSQARRLKTFALLASLVCKLWRNLVEAPGSQRLWICRIGVDLRSPSHDIVRDVAVARLYLNASEGCDVDVKLRCAMGSVPNLGYDLSIASQQSTAIRVVLHFIKFLACFIRQWRDVLIMTSQPELVYLIFSILNQTPIMAPNLINLEIGRFPIGDFPLLVPNDPHSIVSDLDAIDSTLHTSPRLGSHMQLIFHQIDIQNVERLPPGLEDLVLEDCWVNYAPAWQGVLRVAPTLKNLDLKFKMTASSSLSLKDITPPRHDFSSLTGLTITGVPDLLYSALAAFDFRSLARLKLKSYLARPQLNPTSYSNVLLPVLEYILLRTDPESVLRTLDMIATPRLQMIEVDATETYQRSPGKTYMAPRCVIFTCSVGSFCVASVFDFKITETLEFTSSLWVSEVVMEDWPNFHFPVLSSLTLHSHIADSFIKNSEFHNLSMLCLINSLGKPMDIWKLWSEHQGSLSTVSVLQLELPIIDYDTLFDVTRSLTSIPVQHLVLKGHLDCLFAKSIVCVANQHGQILWDRLKRMDVFIQRTYLRMPQIRTPRRNLEYSLSEAVNWFARYGVPYEWQRTLDTNEKVCMSYKLLRVPSASYPH